jgi:hypothetical protein
VFKKESGVCGWNTIRVLWKEGHEEKTTAVLTIRVVAVTWGALSDVL